MTAASEAESVDSFESSPTKYTRLSKPRFEEWLDKICPMASPMNAASKPSIVGIDESEPSERFSFDQDDEICTVKMERQDREEDDVDTVGMVSDKEMDVTRFCGECGREMGKLSRECGVQTDISSRLIIF